MPDSETFKLIIQGGSFGVLVIIAIWLMFKWSPDNTRMVLKMSQDHRETIEFIEQKHDERVEADHLQCAAERKEMLSMFLRESELNRQSRYEQSQRCQGKE